MLKKQREIKKLLVFFFIAVTFQLSCIDNFFILSTEAAEEQITLHYPPDNVTMEFGLLSISLGIPEGSADVITTSNNDKEIIRIIPDLKFECFSVPLELGLNKIQISVMKEGKQIYNTALSVFRRSDLEGHYKNPPSDYRKDYFHMKDRPECVECHELEPREHDKKPISPVSFLAESVDKKTVILSTSTCYSCHKQMASYPYVHGPVAVWSCLSCHDMDSAPIYSVKKPDTEVCFECHKEQKNDWESKKYTHGPVTIGNCTICHSPHASDYPFNLYKSTWNLCVNCHVEKGSGKHVLGDSFSTEGHPTRDRPDPVRIGKELSCASCHDPHASNYPHLWAFEVQTIFDMCKKCHYDK